MSLLESTSLSKPVKEIIFALQITDLQEQLVEASSDNETYLFDFELVAHHKLDFFFATNSTSKPQRHANKLKKLNTKTLFFKREILSISAKFSELNIPSLVLKGVPLNELLYGNNLKRRSLDIDFYVPQKDAKKADELLVSLGYVRDSPNYPLNNKQFNALVTNFDQFRYWHPTKKCCVELHWRLFDNPYLFNLSFEEIWETRRTFKINNTELYTLGSTYELIYLSLHGAHHQWDILLWMIDLKYYLPLLSSSQVQELINLSKKYNLIDAVVLGFYMSEQLVNAVIPQEIKNCYNPKVEKLAKESLLFLEDQFEGKKALKGLLIMKYKVNIAPSFKGKMFHLVLNYPLYQHQYKFLATPNRLIQMIFRPITWLLKFKK